MIREEIIERLKRRQGSKSLREFAGILGCSAAYLSDVYLGRRNPGPKILGALGIEVETTVVREYSKARKVTANLQ